MKVLVQPLRWGVPCLTADSLRTSYDPATIRSSPTLLTPGPSVYILICALIHKRLSLEDLAHCFQALADDTRLRLLKAILNVASERGICVCELVDALRLPQYQVSRHLQQLKSAGWLESQQRGTWVYYAPAEELAPWQRAVLSALRDKLDDPAFQRDAKLLRARLARRRAGLCVIGYGKS